MMAESPFVCCRCGFFVALYGVSALVMRQPWSLRIYGWGRQVFVTQIDRLLVVKYLIVIVKYLNSQVSQKYLKNILKVSKSILERFSMDDGCNGLGLVVLWS